jgi:hypothetical protein
LANWFRIQEVLVGLVLRWALMCVQELVSVWLFLNKYNHCLLDNLGACKDLGPYNSKGRPYNYNYFHRFHRRNSVFPEAEFRLEWVSQFLPVLLLVLQNPR